MSALNHNPADILLQTLLDLGLVSEPEGTADWPGFYSHYPDQPDDLVCVADTESRLHGRTHTDGETQEHYGIQVMVRANREAEGRIKAREIATALDLIVRQEVTLEESIYLVQAVSRVGGVLPLGFESGVSRRRLFTINAVVGLSMTGTVGTGTGSS